MKYSVPYQKGNVFKYYDEIDEINIIYNRSDYTLPDFLKKYENKTVILEIAKINDESEVHILQELHKKFGNIKIKVNIKDKDTVNFIKDAGVPYFFNNLVDSWCTLRWITLVYDVTDVFIGNELGFDLKDVHSYLAENGIAVRVVPHFAQSECMGTPTALKFFIRPEDIDLYSEYVDVLEIYPYNGSVEAYYEIYSQNKSWVGPLSQIIVGAPDLDVDSDKILSSFAKNRLSCRRRCDKPNNSCALCIEIMEVAKHLRDNGLTLIPKQTLLN